MNDVSAALNNGPVQAHFQLTRRCNLACSFCGQSKGMLASEHQDLPLELWLRLAEEIRGFAKTANRPASITLWGGEPLLYPQFDELAETLHEADVRLSIITNGTLLDRHADVVRRCIDVINVSLDGPRPLHDAVRGKGVFEKVAANLNLLSGRRGGLVFLTTVSDVNVDGISRIPFELAKLGPDAIVLQPLMYLSLGEIADYRAWSVAHFGCDYPELEAWERSDDTAYRTTLNRELELIRATRYPVPVKFTPHAYDEQPIPPPCEAPWARVHIRHDGAVGFCTDYFGFSAGNVRELTLREIFSGAKADEFRRAVRENRLPVCRHCPWRKQSF